MEEDHERVAAIERRRFYDDYFLMLVANTILYELGTLGGRYRLEQREVCTSLGSRQSVYTELGQIVEAIRYQGGRGGGKALGKAPLFPLALQMGCIFPMRPSPNEHQWARIQSIRQATLANHGYVPRGMALGEWDEDALKPRQYERDAIRGSAAAPQGEVVIDVDLDPLLYPRPPFVCPCGTAKRVCDTCWWLYMDPAMAALEWILHDFYGFKAVFTVFSGRRGFHTWILDERVHQWTAAQRARFADSLAMPLVRDELWHGVCAVLEPLYEERKHLLDQISTTNGLGCPNTRPGGALGLWPRIDYAVTADATHLHKLPLSAHPETGNVCVVAMQGRWSEAVAAGEQFIPSRDCVHMRDVTRNVMVACEQVIKRAIERI
jgi:hypothetical protein